MFLRPHYRTVDGKRHAYWSLVESVRTERGPRQRVVAYLGGLDEAGRLGVQQAADANSNSNEQPSLFDEESVEIEAPPVANRRQALSFPVGARDLELGYERQQTTSAGQQYTRFRFRATLV